MRLLDRYNRINIFSTIIVIVVAGIVYYLSISYILTDQVDHLLVGEENEIYDYVHLNHRLPQVFETNTQKIVLGPIINKTPARRFIDTPFFNKKEGENEAGRALTSSVNVNGTNYRIVVVESKVETEDLIRAIFVITIGMILILLLVLQLTNRVLLKRLWQPFYNILDKIKVFNLRDMTAIETVDTGIDEFRELNLAVQTMSSRVKNDYQDLKAFTENAAHELLTPVAIINSKLDTLIQSTELDERQSKVVSDLYHCVSRLTRLNKSLLLLVKVENRLVKDMQQVDLKKLISEIVNGFEELFREKELTVSCSLTEKVSETSPYLMEILCNNLISNAIRHNYGGGVINITLNADRLIVQNSGGAEPLHHEDIFKRFNKSAESEGSGLGLTICRQICQAEGFDLDYAFRNSMHTFTVDFNLAAWLQK